MNKIVTATQARKTFFQLLELAGKPGSSVTITLQGHPPLILLSQEEFEGWQETMEIMADPELMQDIRDAMKEKGGIRLEDLEQGRHAATHVQHRSPVKGPKTVRASSRKRSGKSTRSTARAA